MLSINLEREIIISQAWQEDTGHLLPPKKITNGAIWSSEVLQKLCFIEFNVL